MKTIFPTSLLKKFVECGNNVWTIVKHDKYFIQ